MSVVLDVRISVRSFNNQYNMVCPVRCGLCSASDFICTVQSSLLTASPVLDCLWHSCSLPLRRRGPRLARCTCPSMSFSPMHSARHANTSTTRHRWHAASSSARYGPLNMTWLHKDGRSFFLLVWHVSYSVEVIYSFLFQWAVQRVSYNIFHATHFVRYEIAHAVQYGLSDILRCDIPLSSTPYEGKGRTCTRVSRHFGRKVSTCRLHPRWQTSRPLILRR